MQEVNAGLHSPNATVVSRFSTALSAVCSSLDCTEERWLRGTPSHHHLPSAMKVTGHKSSWQQNRFRKLILNTRVKNNPCVY